MSSALYLNKGKLQIEDVTASLAPDLQKPGMVTTAVWLDINKGKRPDLVIAGEWMRVACNDDRLRILKLNRH